LPTNSKLKSKSTVMEDYSDTSVPRGLDAPWFLRDDSDDDALTNTSHHTTPNEADPEDPNYFAPTDHLYDDPPAAPAAPNPFLGEPFTAPPATQENEGGTEKEGGPNRNRDHTPANEGAGAARTGENEGAGTGTL
jgi:hypothetical protein